MVHLNMGHTCRRVGWVSKGTGLRGFLPARPHLILRAGSLHLTSEHIQVHRQAAQPDRVWMESPVLVQVVFLILGSYDGVFKFLLLLLTYLG